MLRKYRPAISATWRSFVTIFRDTEQGFFERIEILTRHLKTTLPTRLRIITKNMPARSMPLQADQREYDSPSSS